MDASSAPLDHALFPEGAKRCQLKWFLLWIAALHGPLMVGVIAAVMCWGLALNVTYLNNNYPFGLWIAADLGIIALGAGRSSWGAAASSVSSISCSSPRLAG